MLVVGNPAHTNAWICAQHAPSLPKQNFFALTRLDQNRAAGQIAHHFGMSVSDVRRAAARNRGSKPQMSGESLEMSWFHAQILANLRVQDHQRRRDWCESQGNVVVWGCHAKFPDVDFALIKGQAFSEAATSAEEMSFRAQDSLCLKPFS